ncbi:MAG: diphosphate--fructose-6-phosphate 1-phosphotransferase, partial [Deltaproteobacteria bacterium]|nr:diphosphate--fructose-6-phosphate 1-phosphotransferase [Deltaproteobacteria bacterium]
VAETPSAALGSSRDKPDAQYCEKILAAFAERNVRSFFYIGGNDSADTCRLVAELARARSYPLETFHVPKTIDNDLVGSDHTPGFPSAARFVACAFMGDNLDNRALPGVKINVVMGRHAGFLTAASVLARPHPGDGPHLIYVPERVFDLDSFVSEVRRVHGDLGRCLVAVSEGVHTRDGTPMVTVLAKSLAQDAHGNVQLSGTGALGDFLAEAVKKALGKKTRVRADTFGYLQRSFPDCVSAVDAAEAREVGRVAVACAAAGEPSGSIAIQRQPGPNYAPRYLRLPLSEVAAKTRVLAEEYLAGAHDVSEAFVRYLQPLVGELPVVARLYPGLKADPKNAIHRGDR